MSDAAGGYFVCVGTFQPYSAYLSGLGLPVNSSSLEGLIFSSMPKKKKDYLSFVMFVISSKL